MSGAIYPSLKDRVVFVTGGATGIGAGIVEAFAEQGSKVAFVDLDVRAGHDLAERLGKTGAPKPLFLQCDLRDIPALRAAIQKASAQLGVIRTLVNNAANDERHALDTVTPEYWDDRMAVNLRHQFFAVQAIYPAMAKAGGGSIVNLGSVTWLLGEGGMPGYSAAKAAIAGLTRSLARDLGPHNIRVNSVLPGWIMTERQVKLWLDETGERQIRENQCLKEKLYPPDIARMVLWLAADDSRLCTAQNFIVDAGWT